MEEVAAPFLWSVLRVGKGGGGGGGGGNEENGAVGAADASQPTPKKRALAFSACLAFLTCIILLAHMFTSLILSLAENDDLWDSIQKLLRQRTLTCLNHTSSSEDQREK